MVAAPDGKIHINDALWDLFQSGRGIVAANTDDKETPRRNRAEAIRYANDRGLTVVCESGVELPPRR